MRLWSHRWSHFDSIIWHLALFYIKNWNDWRHTSKVGLWQVSLPICWSEFSVFRVFSAGIQRNSAVPPPATIPSSTAARVAFKASLMRSFFSFTSTSLVPPTCQREVVFVFQNQVHYEWAFPLPSKHARAGISLKGTLYPWGEGHRNWSYHNRKLDQEKLNFFTTKSFLILVVCSVHCTKTELFRHLSAWLLFTKRGPLLLFSCPKKIWHTKRSKILEVGRLMTCNKKSIPHLLACTNQWTALNAKPFHLPWYTIKQALFHESKKKKSPQNEVLNRPQSTHFSQAQPLTRSPSGPTTTLGKHFKSIFSLDLLPWYNCLGWLDIPNQITYSLTH